MCVSAHALRWFLNDRSKIKDLRIQITLKMKGSDVEKQSIIQYQIMCRLLLNIKFTYYRSVNLTIECLNDTKLQKYRLRMLM